MSAFNQVKVAVKVKKARAKGNPFEAFLNLNLYLNLFLEFGQADNVL